MGREEKVNNEGVMIGAGGMEEGVVMIVGMGRGRETIRLLVGREKVREVVVVRIILAYKTAATMGGMVLNHPHKWRAAVVVGAKMSGIHLMQEISKKGERELRHRLGMGMITIPLIKVVTHGPKEQSRIIAGVMLPIITRTRRVIVTMRR